MSWVSGQEELLGQATEECAEDGRSAPTGAMAAVATAMPSGMRSSTRLAGAFTSRAMRPR